MSTISLGTPYPIRTRASAPRPGLRLTRRGRLVVLLATLALVLGAFVALGPAVIATGESGDPVPVTTVTVRPGQTLWDIAGEANPTGDIRHTVHDIAELNSLPSAGEVQAGREIAVPRY